LVAGWLERENIVSLEKREKPIFILFFMYYSFFQLFLLLLFVVLANATNGWISDFLNTNFIKFIGRLKVNII
jgi:hypothetical protein